MPDVIPELPPEPELARLAAALAKLRPAPAQFETPAFHFRAGQASRDAALWRWKIAVGVLMVALIGTWIFTTVRLRDLHQQVAKAQENPPATNVPTPQSVVEVPPELPPIVPPPVPAYPLPDLPPVVTVASYDPDPTPEELAEALRQRNQILIAGLSLLPRTVPPTGNETHSPLPGGVFTTPRHEPKKPAPVFPPDDDE